MNVFGVNQRKHICLVDRADITLLYSPLSKEKHKADVRPVKPNDGNRATDLDPENSRYYPRAKCAGRI
jgi:hypothetical protein